MGDQEREGRSEFFNLDGATDFSGVEEVEDENNFLLGDEFLELAERVMDWGIGYKPSDFVSKYAEYANRRNNLFLEGIKRFQEVYFDLESAKDMREASEFFVNLVHLMTVQKGFDMGISVEQMFERSHVINAETTVFDSLGELVRLWLYKSTDTDDDEIFGSADQAREAFNVAISEIKQTDHENRVRSLNQRICGVSEQTSSSEWDDILDLACQLSDPTPVSLLVESKFLQNLEDYQIGEILRLVESFGDIGVFVRLVEGVFLNRYGENNASVWGLVREQLHIYDQEGEEEDKRRVLNVIGREILSYRTGNAENGEEDLEIGKALLEKYADDAVVSDFVRGIYYWKEIVSEKELENQRFLWELMREKAGSMTVRVSMENVEKGSIRYDEENSRLKGERRDINDGISVSGEGLGLALGIIGEKGEENDGERLLNIIGVGGRRIHIRYIKSFFEAAEKICGPSAEEILEKYSRGKGINGFQSRVEKRYIKRRSREILKEIRERRNKS